MSTDSNRRRWAALVGALVVVAGLGGGWLARAGAQTDLALPPIAPELTLPRVTDAAWALRRGDCPAAHATVGRLRGAAGPDETGFLDLLDGLYAGVCGEADLAVQRLVAAGEPSTPGDGIVAAFEDWRLLVLAESAGRSRPAIARASWDLLLADHPASPLRPRALLGAARAARAAGDAARALEVAGLARDEGIAGAEGAALAELAWEVAGESGDTSSRAAVARHLLTFHPLRAEELGALAALRPAPVAGAPSPPDWSALLSPDELLARAAALQAARRYDAALTALRAIPADRRGAGWHLSAAAALTAAGRGREALALLEPLSGFPEDAGRVAWARGTAALSAAAAPGVSDPERRDLRAAAESHLEAAAADRVDRRLSARALARLAELRWDAGRRDSAVQTYVRLREVDPRDLAGAKRLWEAGWQGWVSGDLAGATARWAELAGLYPESSYTRYGRYWTARAAAASGDADRARRIYREVASGDVVDLYGALAADRLGEAPRRATPLAVDRGLPWPDHPVLLRARLLTDLGLDAHAETESKALAGPDAGEVDPARARAAHALAALILARQGEPRASIQRIHDAFPVLGGPLQAAVPETALRLYYPLEHGETVRDAARRNGLDPHLVFAMIRQESAFDVDATSSAGARGLMQLMPATAKERARKLGLPWNHARMAEPGYNVTLGTSYFRQVLGIFDGSVELALAGYNGGPYRIRRLWNERPSGTPLDEFLEGLPISESRTYVKRILMLADGYRQLYPGGETPEPV